MKLTKPPSNSQVKNQHSHNSSPPYALMGCTETTLLHLREKKHSMAGMWKHFSFDGTKSKEALFISPIIPQSLSAPVSVPSNS